MDGKFYYDSLQLEVFSTLFRKLKATLCVFSPSLIALVRIQGHFGKSLKKEGAQ